MEILEKDQLFILATKLDLPQLLKFCRTNKKINKLICQRDDIWLYKLNREFPDYRNSGITGSYKKIYEILFIRGLETIKRTFKLKYNLDELYNLQELNLSFNQIRKIPKEIGQLQNLQELYLSGNIIKEIPKEIGRLNKLQILKLTSNQIKEIPKEIGQLQNLKELSLGSNQIKEIPKEIGQLKNLKELSLFYNKINEIPDFVNSDVEIYI